MVEKLSADGKKIEVYMGGSLMYQRDKVGGYMHEIIPTGKSGEYSVIHRVATENDVAHEKLRSLMRRSGEFLNFEPGTYTILSTKTDTVMSDTPMEINTNREFVSVAHGDVLIGGLGLGIVLLAIQDKTEVKTVTVVEFSEDVIKLVACYLPLNNKVKIVKCDINAYVPESGCVFNTIYFDIWNGICSDNYQQMKGLHKRFRKYKDQGDPDFWISSWRLKCCRKMYRYEK